MILLLLLAPGWVGLIDELVRVPRGEWRTVSFSLRQRPAILECEFAVEAGRSDVRVLLMSEEEFERFRDGDSHRALVETPYTRSGRFRQRIVRPGEFRVVVENRRETRGPAGVRLRVNLRFLNQLTWQPSTLSPWRKLVVISASLLFFVGLSFWCGRRLLAAVERRGQVPPGTAF